MADSKYCDEETPLVISRSFKDIDSVKTSRTQIGSQGQPTYVRGYHDGNWRSGLQDAEYRSKVIKSFAMCLCFFSVGMATGQLGPALLDLQLITHTNVQKASVFLAAASAGNMVGSAVSGVIYDHLSSNLLPIFSELLMGLMLLIIPFCSLYWLMVSACFFLGVFRMCSIIAATMEIFTLWGVQATMFLQAAHFSYSVGGIVAPLVTEPFLAPRNDTEAVTTDHSNRSTNSTHDLHLGFDLATDAPPDNTTLGVPGVPDTRIHFAFMITSTTCFLVSAFLAEEYARGCFEKTKRRSSYARLNGDGRHATTTTNEQSGRDPQGNSVTEDQRNTKEFSGENPDRPSPTASGVLYLPTVPYVAVMVWIGLFFLTTIATQNSNFTYLATYAVLQMRWTKSQGAFLTSLYWIAIGFTRFVCIFLANCFSPMKFLIFSFIFLVPSSVMFTLMSLYRLNWGVWLSTGLCGAALSPVYAVVMSWVNANLVTLTGKVNSYIGMASHAGVLLSNLILGYFIENYGSMSFAYVTLGEATLSSLIFICLLLFTRLCLRPKYSARKDVIVTYSAANNGSTSTTLK